MPIIVKTLDLSAWAAWEDYAAGHPDATFFHRAGWSRVIEASFGHPTHYLYAERGGRVCGLLPLAHYRSWMFGNALISNACCMGGGPVADDDGAYAALDAAALALMERVGADYLEYRRPCRRHADWRCRDNLYVTFEQPIDRDEETALKRIPRKQRAVVRKALQSGLADEMDTGIDRFYALYAANVHNHGTPVFSKGYFRNLMAEFGADCDILTVCHEGTALSSVLSFYHRGRVMPYYTGSAGLARDLGANDFMYWRLMRRAADRGCTIFDFGRSKIGTGPYAFKKNWGFDPIPVVHEYRTRDGQSLPDLNPLNPKYRLFIAVWKRLPLPVANLLGPNIVRNIG